MRAKVIARLEVIFDIEDGIVPGWEVLPTATAPQEKIDLHAMSDEDLIELLEYSGVTL